MNEETKGILDWLQVNGRLAENQVTWQEQINLSRKEFKAGVWSISDVVRAVQTERDAQLGDRQAEEYFFIIASSIISEVEHEYEESDTELKALTAKMEEVEKKHGLKDNEYWLIKEAPIEYQALNDIWDRRSNEITEETMKNFGENEMAKLYIHNREKFDRIYNAGMRMFHRDNPEVLQTLDQYQIS